MGNSKLKRTVLLSAAILPMIMASSGTTKASAETISKEYTSGGMVQFKPDSSPTDPVDPNNPDPENPVKPWDPTTPDHKPNPGTDGPLSLDFASSLDFGNNKITNKDVTYYAEPQYLWNAAEDDFDPDTARPNYVQVTDKRGNNGGWSLRLKQLGQFENKETLNKTLTGSEISFKDGKAVSVMEDVKAPTTSDILSLKPDQEVPVMSAEKNAGAGTWVDRFGKLENVDVEGKTVLKNKAISLSVPGTTPKDAVKYETKLLWTLSDVPGNESEDGK